MHTQKAMKITIILSLLFASTTVTGAAEELDDCGKAWRTHKNKFLKAGKLTLGTLGFAIFIRGFVFPGTPNDNSALKRYALNLAMHGLDSDVPDSYKLANSAVQPLSHERLIHPVLTCLEMRKKHQECIELAIRKKTILPFEELVEELEFYAAREGAGEAYCGSGSV